MIMIAAVPSEGENERERKKGRLTRLTASRLAAQLSTERQVLKHCNLDSLLAIVKTLAQSVEGLTGLKSLSVEAHTPSATFSSLRFIHSLFVDLPCKMFEDN